MKVISMEELMVEVITKDKGLQDVLAKKVAEAMNTIDFGDIVARNIEETINNIFEGDELYDLIGDAIKEELAKAIAAHFKK